LFDANGNVVLTDFGLSKENVPDNTTARSFVGTPEYLAPEVVMRSGHGKAADFYSLGVVLYELITGQPPFYHQNPERLYHKVRTSPSFLGDSVCSSSCTLQTAAHCLAQSPLFSFFPFLLQTMHDVLRVPPYLTPAAQSLLRGLLERNIRKRIRSAEALRSHAFFAFVDWDEVVQKRQRAPYEPHLTADADTSHFDTQFTTSVPRFDENDWEEALQAEATAATLRRAGASEEDSYVDMPRGAEMHYEGFEYVREGEDGPAPVAVAAWGIPFALARAPGGDARAGDDAQQPSAINIHPGMAMLSPGAFASGAMHSIPASSPTGPYYPVPDHSPV
jgi:hypothetical protein